MTISVGVATRGWPTNSPLKVVRRDRNHAVRIRSFCRIPVDAPVNRGTTSGLSTGCYSNLLLVVVSFSSLIGHMRDLRGHKSK
jgi:hypothetical protein